MRIRLPNELLLINLLAIPIVVTATFFPTNALRIILGLPFVLFFPGYTLVLALFPRKGALGNIERVALSFGLSIAVVPLIGLILNYTPWGIRLYPILLSLVIFIAATSLIAWHRRRMLAETDRFTISLNLSLHPWRGRRLADKALSIILIATIVGAIGIVGSAIAIPRVGERFTEFYAVDLLDEAIRYPTELGVGEEGRVIVCIINREHEIVSYWVEVRINGVKNNQTESLELKHDEKWEGVVGFTPDKVGDNQKVEFLLYRHGGSESYRKLHLWVNVRG